MIICIQCAASKRPDAGYLQTRQGKELLFVANPEIAPTSNEYIYAHPDDQSDQGKSWRDVLLAYNANPGPNPLGLLPAYELYEKDTYRRLAERFGLENVYILSAGWGLISASFPTPYYDITFSAARNVDRYKRRKKSDTYKDLCLLPDNSNEDLLFFGGKSYIPLFCKLTRTHPGNRIIFYNSTTQPNAPGCTLRKFSTRTRTNWHYECAEAFINNQVPA